jgi:hypothetical protein
MPKYHSFNSEERRKKTGHGSTCWNHMPYTINCLDVAYGKEHGDVEIIDILVNSSTDMVYLVADVHN